MANLTNSGKLITKIEAIDSSISDIEDKIGSVPAGTDIMAEIGAVDDKVDWVIDSIGTVPSGSTVMNEIWDVDSDLQGYKTTVAETYATKAEITSVYKYKGSVANYDALPTSGQVTGDVYNVEAAHTTAPVFPAWTNVAWNGTAWDALWWIEDLSDFFSKTNDDADDILEGSSHLFLTTAERTKLGNTSGVNTGDQSASDFDIKDLADSTNLRDTWSGKQDAISDLENIRSRAQGSIQASDATFVSNTVSEGADGSVTVTAADNVTVATAETNNKAAISALGTAHNNLVDRVEAVESATWSLPFEAYFVNWTFNGKVLEISNANILATSHVSYVVTAGALNWYYVEREVQAGKVTLTSSDNETCTVEVMIINKKSA